MAVPHPPADDLPEDFAQAVASLRSAALRSEVVVHEAPAPQRLAPYAVALAAEVVVADEQLANGRLVVLHDPQEPEPWEGSIRLVAYARAPLDLEIGADPLLPSVGWSWLMDALTAAGAGHRAAGGTVTRVASERFGALTGHPDAAEVEVRASWTPDDADLAPHLAAFAELLCCAAGLPPLPAGVVSIPLGRPRSRSRAR